MVKQNSLVYANILWAESLVKCLKYGNEDETACVLSAAPLLTSWRQITLPACNVITDKGPLSA